MITSPRRPTFSPPVTRHFEFTRLQDQLIARAYQALIPVVSRPLERPRSPRSHSEPSTKTFRDLRSQARGA
jgi:hypothetical protein